MATAYRFPKSFVTHHVTLSWHDMLYGLQRGFLDDKTVRELATERVTLQSEPQSPEMRLASMSGDDPADVRDVLTTGAESEGANSDHDSERKWCFLALQWLFDHREQTADPLSEAETAYADFGYPAEVAPFVRYEPGPQWSNEPTDPHARLMARWAKYLADRHEEFGPGSSA